MESNLSNQEYFDSGSPLDEPHFNEEATLLSARPVVPLQTIQAAARSRKGLLFGLAIVCSLAMGALAAAVLYKQPLQEPSLGVSQAAPDAAGLALEAPVDAVAGVEGAAAGTSPQPEAQTLPIPHKSSTAVARSPVVVVTRRKTDTPPLIEEEEPNWDERLYERRRRRVSERQALRKSRRRQRRSSDDLLRIREIFEGPSRP